MSLEQDNQSVDLDVLEDLLSFYLRSVTYGLSRDLDQRLDGLEVARGTGKITALLLIASHPGIRPSEIAKATLRDRPSVSRVIAPLVASGLVEQRAAPQERRAQELRITAHGHEVAAQVRRIVRAQSEDFFAAVPEEDQAELLRILRRIYGRLRSAGE